MTDVARRPVPPEVEIEVDPESAEPFAGRGDEVTLIACPDGPILVRGPARLVTPDGTPIERRRRTVALCRCGTSRIKPYCDGTHKAIGFRTEPEA